MKKNNIFWGLFCILAAVLLVLSQINIIPNDDIVNLLLTVFFLEMLISGIKNMNWFKIFFSLAFIGIIYDEYLGTVTLTPWISLLAALLLSIGFSLIFSRNKYNNLKSEYDRNDDRERYNENNVVFNVAFSSSAKHINSTDFCSANINCSFGALKIYLDNADILDSATINFDLIFAGVELYIPKKYKVINNVECLLGGVDEKKCSNISDTKNIYLNGKISFAGITVIYI